MANFGETIAYWYLRLNGFIPMRNFVFHRNAEGVQSSGDADLLAVRFPFATEKIQTCTLRNDQRLFTQWPESLNRAAALVVDVKTGRRTGGDIDDDKLLSAIQRVGVASNFETACEVRERLKRGSHTDCGDWLIGKLLINETGPVSGWLYVGLGDAVSFIRDRFAEVRSIRAGLDPKYADRVYFPGDLIHFIAWEGRESTSPDTNSSAVN
jgi:hypothetical protein